MRKFLSIIWITLFSFVISGCMLYSLGITDFLITMGILIAIIAGSVVTAMAIINLIDG